MRRAVPLLVALVLILAACGPNASNSASPTTASTVAPPASGSAPAESQAPLTASGDIFAYGFAYETGDIIAKTRADVFKEKYPDVKVTWSESGFDDQQFLAALAGSDKPDAVNLPRNKIGTYIAQGVLEPLDDCIAKTGFDTSVFYDAAKNDVTVDGKMYAFPEFYNTRNWIINNKAFKDAGIDPNSLNWGDWDAIKQANDKLVKKDGDKITRIGIDPKIPEFLPLWVKADGGSVISDDGKTSQLDSQQTIDAVKYTTDLVKAQGDPTKWLDFRNTWDFFGAKNQVASDQVGAWPMEQWYLNVLAQNSPDVDITVKPFMTKDGQPITYEDGNSWAIVKGTDNPDAACALASTMVATDTWVAAGKARAEDAKKNNKPQTGVYTGNREADKIIFDQYVDLSDMPVFEAAVKAVLDNQENAFGSAPSPGAAGFQQALTDGVNRVLSGSASAEDSMKQAQQEAQDAIDSGAS
jgi:multiple sugar transport system substrate-binding protein